IPAAGSPLSAQILLSDKAHLLPGKGVPVQLEERAAQGAEGVCQSYPQTGRQLLPQGRASQPAAEGVQRLQLEPLGWGELVGRNPGAHSALAAAGTLCPAAE